MPKTLDIFEKVIMNRLKLNGHITLGGQRINTWRGLMDGIFTFIKEGTDGVEISGGNLTVEEEVNAQYYNQTTSTWDDLRVPVLSTKVPAAKLPEFAKVLDNGSGSQGLFTYLFDASTEEELYFTCQVPHSWKFGTALHPHVHWMPVANGAEGKVVSWGLEYSVAEIGTTFADSEIIYGNTTLPNETLVADRHYLTDLGDIDMSGVDSVSPMLICRIFRDATGAGKTDDYPSDAALIEIDFHFEIDYPGGSRQEYVK